MVSHQDSIHILLGDDDEDDIFLFKSLLADIYPQASLITSGDGEALMNLLSTFPTVPPPHLIFLDVNMPRRNGMECLIEIRSNKKFDHIPVFMFSTSMSPTDIHKAYENGANLYIPKGLFFTKEKQIIEQFFSVHWKDYIAKVPKEQFVLTMINQRKITGDNI